MFCFVRHLMSLYIIASLISQGFIQYVKGVGVGASPPRTLAFPPSPKKLRDAI